MAPLPLQERWNARAHERVVGPGLDPHWLQRRLVRIEQRLDRVQRGSSGSSGACNTLTNDAPVVSKTTHAGAAPAMTGGTIADGTYILTAIDKYNGSVGTNTLQEKWVFSGNTLQIVGSDSSSGVGETHASATYAVTGNSITITASCPGPTSWTTLYTATPTEFQTEDTSSNDDEVHTYALQ